MNIKSCSSIFNRVLCNAVQQINIFQNIKANHKSYSNTKIRGETMKEILLKYVESFPWALTGNFDCSGMFSLSGGVASDDPVSAAHVALGTADQQRMAAALLRLQIHFQCFVQLLVVTEPLHLGFWLSSHSDTQLQ